MADDPAASPAPASTPETSTSGAVDLTVVHDDLVRTTAAGVPRWLDVAGQLSWRTIVIAIVLSGAAAIMATLYLVTIPLAVAMLICTLTVPPTRALQRRGWPPAAAAFTVVLGGFAVIVGVIALIAPTFVDQVTELGPTLGEARDQVVATLGEAPFNFDQERLNELLSQATSGGSTNGILSSIVSGATIVMEVLAGFVLMIVLVFFFTKDGGQIIDWVQSRAPQRHRPLVSALGQRAWTALGGFVRGTAVIALIDAAFIGIGLAVIGVPLVLPITLIVFLGGFLPVIGAFLSGSIGVLVALAAGGIEKAGLALLVVLAVQQLEGNILQPLIMKRSVHLHPVVVILALTAGASIAGITGAFLSVPLAAVIAAVGNEVRVRAELPGPQGSEPVTGPPDPDHAI